MTRAEERLIDRQLKGMANRIVTNQLERLRRRLTHHVDSQRRTTKRSTRRSARASSRKRRPIRRSSKS